MNEIYDGGYIKALRDVLNYITEHEEHIHTVTKNSRKKYETLIKTLLSLLLTDDNAREIWTNMGAECNILVDPKTCAVTYVVDGFEYEEIREEIGDEQYCRTF